MPTLIANVYRPPTKLRGGNVFCPVCLSVILSISVGKRAVDIRLKCLLFENVIFLSHPNVKTMNFVADDTLITVI